jgi:hypothetical protein
MSSHIDKDNPNRWFYVQNNGTGKDSLIMFGNLGEVNLGELISGQPIVVSYFTEQELETQVNIIANDNEYYKLSVELEGKKFLMPSGLYSPIIVD